MEYSYLSEHFKISKICFGCEPLGGSDWGDVNLKEIEAAIRFALENGVNFFDTADVYGLGLSESRLSEILGSKRFEVVIATKGGVEWEKTNSKRAQTRKNISPEYLSLAVEDSLRRLKLDCIPIYYVHWPDNKTDLRFTFELLNKLKEKGKINHIACSNFNSKQLIKACEVSKVSLVQLPVNYLLNKVADDTEKVCQDYDIGIVAYNVLAQGLLTGKFNQDTKFPENDRRSRLPIFEGENFTKALKKVEKLKDEAIDLKISLVDLAIKWALEQNKVVSAITGIKNTKQIRDNLRRMKSDAKD